MTLPSSSVLPHFWQVWWPSLSLPLLPSPDDHSLLTTVSSLGYTLWLRLGVVGFLLALLWTVLVDLIGSGILVASILW